MVVYVSYILTTSPSSSTSFSSASAEKCPTTLLRDIQVGNAIPFEMLFCDLRTFFTSSTIKLSPDWHNDRTVAPALSSVTILARACVQGHIIFKKREGGRMVE